MSARADNDALSLTSFATVEDNDRSEVICRTY